MDDPIIIPRREYHFDIENTEIMLFSNISSPRKKYVPMYAHSFYVIIFVINGSACVPIENKGDICLSSGEAVIVSKGVKHMLELTGKDTFSVGIGFSLNKKSEYSTNNLYGALEKLFADDYILLDKSCNAISLVDKCYSTTELGNKYAVASVFYELMVELMRYRGVIPQDAMTEPSRDSETARIHRINTIANAYYDKNITIDDIAKMLYLSPRQVNRIIDSHFGTTWSALIIDKRMKVARDLLTAGNMSLEEIAEYVGYSSLRGFSTAYKKYYGTAPGRDH